MINWCPFLCRFFENQRVENEKQKILETNEANGNVSFNRFMEFEEVKNKSCTALSLNFGFVNITRKTR